MTREAGERDVASRFEREIEWAVSNATGFTEIAPETVFARSSDRISCGALAPSLTAKRQRGAALR